MMVAWDNDENRPVPPVLIDCGAKFRKVPSAVVGSTEPIAHDPEPQLWKEEEERMAEEERRRQEAENEERLAEDERQRRQEAMAGEKRKGNFVDVDDMVEEKVELKMEDVVVAPPPKKKKKKKSLL
jgi:type IV secretory pathway VirB10-like protein